MVSDNDVLGAVGIRDPTHGGKCVEPHNSERYGFYDHVDGEDAERQVAGDGADAVFDCAHGVLGVAYVFVGTNWIFIEVCVAKSNRK